VTKHRCQARIIPDGPQCGAAAEWTLALADGLVEVHACQAHRDYLARVFSSLMPDPGAGLEAILRDARRPA